MLRVRIEEVVAVVGEAGGCQGEDARAAVEDLVDDLALVVQRRVIAEKCICACCRVYAALVQLDPRIVEASLRSQGGAESSVGGASVSSVCVAQNDDRIARGPGVDVVGDLLQVSVACDVILVQLVIIRFDHRLIRIRLTASSSLCSINVLAC